MPARKGNIGDPTIRNALLDATAHLMVAEGYAAATTRRVADRAGVNNGLVSYYFGSLDGMFLALFQRGAERSFERLAQVLGSPQPLWGFWDLIHDRTNTALTVEFIALANHRDVIREAFADHSTRFRRAELNSLSQVLRDYGIESEACPPAVVVLGLSSVSRFLLVDQGLGIDIGHAATEAAIEAFIGSLEGDRKAPRKTTAS